ncbi:unnamed protein product [Blepharisma stoltei]|uniref:Sugar transporter SWEET n=1 Tax=Blepharisma stoltei TaxID=1481888 RepID=A0AAU9JLH2_9CILI|nr:unnamed protein product [Blepharisma stoltei]
MSEYLPVIFSSLGIGICFCLNLMPIPSLLKANKTKDLTTISHLYLIVSAFNYMSWIVYSVKMQLIGNLINNSVCLCLDLSWVIFYHKIKGDLLIFVPLFLIFSGCIESAVYFLCPAFVMGVIALNFSICLYAAPIEQLKYVFKQKNHRYIDIYVIPALMLNALAWTCYGFAVNDWFIISPNFPGLTFSLFQIIAYFWARGNIKFPLFEWIYSKSGKEQLIEEQPAKIQPNQNVESV